MNDDVLIVSATRLPIGRFGGALKEVSDWDLGATVIWVTMCIAGGQGIAMIVENEQT